MQHYLKKVQVIYLEYHGKKNEEIALDILSESHITLQKKGVSQSSKKVNTELIGDFCAEDITVKGVTILKSGNKITETHIKELQRLLVETIPVFSDDLGEIVFLNKNLVLSSS